MPSSTPGRVAAPPALGEAPWQAEEARIRDAYARRGNLSRYSWFNRAHLLGMQEVERRVLDALAGHHSMPLEETRVLDVGCGTGVWLREFVKWGARPDRVCGIDLLADRISEARRVCPAGVTLQCGNAAQLEFENGSFDLVLQSMLFSSVLDVDMRRRIAREMLRVVSPSGLVLSYDYHMNNPRNTDVRRVTAVEIHQLFPGCDIHLQRTTLAAPLARIVAPRSMGLYRLLSSIPVLRTHYLAVIRTRAA
jgi:ubiquinone/menaquinone biosynthesis C-methylase UbiE